MKRLPFWQGKKKPSADEKPNGMNEQYANGDFDFLYSLEELSHYMVILGYIRYFGKQPAILDVGCGEGRLADILTQQDYDHYHGVDISPIAIQRARKKRLPRMSFSLADFQTWNPDRSYDLIIFCESLYYVPRPKEVLQHYVPYLAQGGYMILSVYRFMDQAKVWEGLDQDFNICAGDSVQNQRGTWDMRVYAPWNAG